MADHGSAEIANPIFVTLVGAANATLPEIDLYDDLFNIPWDEDSAIYQTLKSLDPSVITSKEVGGTGIFDVMMSGFSAHLQAEYDAGRITGGKYAESYVALTQSAMQNAVQFALGKDQAFWMAARGQADAITAKTNAEIAKLQAMLSRAQYALTKLKLATEDSSYAQSELQVDDLLPAQAVLLVEQGNAQRAQTSNTRTAAPMSDGATVAGMLGKQKDLYTQQIVSYQEDVKIKAGKVFLDAWVTQKTLNESVEPSKYFEPAGNPTPGVYSEKALDPIFKALRQSVVPASDPDYGY